jgi:hypothetical protein
MAMDQRTLQTIRLAIGLLQGLVLYALYFAFNSKLWPASAPLVFAPLLATAVFVPLAAISGLGNMRLRTLSAWLCVAAVLCAVIAGYDIFRDPIDLTGASEQPRILPSVGAVLAIAAILFIAHSLVAAGEADHRWLAGYPTYFDVSWKHGVQTKLVILFVGVLWGILYLGASLFALIKITVVLTLITKPLFWIPVTAVSAGYALHLTDVRAGIVRGTRTLVLLLLSWLLPVMVIFAVGFVLALPFTGVDVLWSTRRGAQILLLSAAVLVFLINSAYQDGTDAVAALLRYCRVAGSIVLIPLVALAAYALALRVGQHGWSPSRVIAAACIIIAACYALGYSFAALRSGLALTRLEPVNVFTAYAVIAVLVVLHSPIIDPARISVASQMARLDGGAVAPEKFDYGFLRFHSGRYGREALQALAERRDGPNAALIADRAKAAIAAKNVYALNRAPRPLPSPSVREANITVVFPKGAVLPETFRTQDWSSYNRQWMLPRCLTADLKCDAALIDLDGDGKDEVLLFSSTVGQSAAFASQDEKTWTYLGALLNPNCPAFRDDLRQGELKTIDTRFKDIEAGGHRVRVQPEVSCPPKPATSPQGR